MTSIYGLLVCYCEHIWNNTPLHLDSWFLVIYELTQRLMNSEAHSSLLTIYASFHLL
jgi:hypothetical protein